MNRYVRRGSSGNMIRIRILDATGVPVTGLTAADIPFISAMCDNESVPVVYDNVTPLIEGLDSSTPGIYVAPSSGFVRFGEVDPVNYKGEYELQFENSRFAVGGSKELRINILSFTTPGGAVPAASLVNDISYIVALDFADAMAAQPAIHRVILDQAAANLIIRVRILDSVGNPVTGLTDADIPFISTQSDVESVPVVYDNVTPLIEGLDSSTPGLYVPPTSGFIRFGEVDPTNQKGVYEIQMENTRFIAGTREMRIMIPSFITALTAVPAGALVNDTPYNISLITSDPNVATALSGITSLNQTTVVGSGIVASSTSTTVTATTALGVTTDNIIGCEIDFYDGVAFGQARTIIGYVSGTKVYTVDRPFQTNPGVGNNFRVKYKNQANLDSNLAVARVTLVDAVTGGATSSAVAAIQSDTDDIQTRLPAALTAGGNIKSDIFGFLGTVFTEGAAGRIAAAFKQFFNIASPTNTMDTLATSTSVAAVQSDTDDIQSRLPAALTGGGNMKADALKINGSTPNDPSASTIAAAVLAAIWPGASKFTGAVAADAGNTATTFKTNLSQTETDHWKDSFLTFTSGTLNGQTHRISAFNGSTKFITMATAFSTAPTAADTFLIVNV